MFEQQPANSPGLNKLDLSFFTVFSRLLQVYTGIRVRQTRGQNLDDRIVSNNVVRPAMEFVRRNVHA